MKQFNVFAIRNRVEDSHVLNNEINKWIVDDLDIKSRTNP